jgi:uncharacterized membrane protein
MPAWALTLAYWVHMAATVVWIGGLFFQAVVVSPALSATLPPEQAARLLRSLRRRFSPLAWFSLVLLIATGLTQMSGSPHYTGLLQIGNTWSAAILAKHLVIGLMVLAAAAQTWLLQPELERALLRPEPTGASQHSAQRYRQLTSVNLVLGLVVLALTAVARTA